MGEEGEQKTYAAGQLREFARGEVDKPNRFLSEFAGLIDAESELMDLIHTYQEAYEEFGEDFEDTDLYARLVRRGADPTATKAVKDGNISVLQNFVGLVEGGASQEEAVGRILKEIQGEAFIGIISAEPSSGKTNMALWLYEWWVKLKGGPLITNVVLEGARQNGGIQYLDSHPWVRDDETARNGIIYVETEQQLRDVLKDVDGESLVVIDEFGNSGGDSNSHNAKELARMATEIRKDPWRADLVLIDQNEKGIEKKLREIATLAFEKERDKKKEAQAYREFSDGFEDPAFKVPKIPQTEISYQDKIQPQFEFGEGSDDEEGLTEKEQIEKARAYRDTGMSWREIADKDGMEHSHEWYRNALEE
jgi:hypothetical protein